MNQISQKLEYIVEHPGNLYFLGLHDESGGLTILLKKLKSEHEVLRIRFKGVLGYRTVQESGRLKTINELSPLSTFSIVPDSPFLKWFKEESGGVFDDSELVHYMICNIDNTIDVISGPPVDVEWTILE